MGNKEMEGKICYLAKELIEVLEKEKSKSMFQHDFKVDEDLKTDKEKTKEVLKKLLIAIQEYLK